MWAILSIIAGFWPFGIVATVYANRSTSLVASSQIGAATEASRKALRWMIASFLTLPLCLALMIGYALIARHAESLPSPSRHDEWQARAGWRRPIPLLYSQSSSAGMVPALESQGVGHGSGTGGEGCGRRCAGRPVEGLLHRAGGPAVHGGPVRGGAAGTNAGRGSNTSGSSNIITNGSKIIVPEGYGLLLFQDGAITAFVAEPGGYEWRSDDLNSQSIFAGDGLVSTFIKQSWERFKFGGQPGSQQAAYFVSLKELPDNRFGTQSEIYWDDGFLNTQVGAVTRGSYTLKIVDPILFVKNFVPASYLQPGQVFDFTDLDNAAASQLFNEVVGSLAPAFSLYTNDPGKGNRITKLQQDSLGFAQSLSAAVEQGYQWKSDRGLAIVKTAIVSIEYDANTRELLKTVQRADALSGSRGNSNLQASVAQGIQSAGENGGAAGLVGVGMASGMFGVGGMQQPVAPAADDPVAKLKKAKEMLDLGLITQATTTRSRPRHWACNGRTHEHVRSPKRPTAAARIRARDAAALAGGVVGWAGSPQDVPPLPGSFPLDTSKLPQAIRDEVEAPDPVAIDTSASELKDGLNRCPKCGATDIRPRPAPTSWSACTAVTNGMARASRKNSGWARPSTSCAARSSPPAHATSTPTPRHDDVQVHRLRRRSHGQHRKHDDGALPLVPPRVRRQRADRQRRGARCGAALPYQEGRCGRAHPPVRRQAPHVRAEGVQGPVHPGKRGGRVPALHDRRQQCQRGRGRQGRDQDARIHGGQREEQAHPVRRRCLPGRAPGRFHRRRPAAGILGRARQSRYPRQHQQHHQHHPAVRHQERGEVERLVPGRLHLREAQPGCGKAAAAAGRPAAVDRPRRWKVR
jgi:membrane protease subunit (stomatin/prohibitin family)